MSRQELSLDLENSSKEKFEAIQKALGHDELEETLDVLLRLAEAAIALTTSDQPEVRLYTRGKLPASSHREAKCPSCGHQFVPVYPEDDGYREISVKLA